MQTTTTKQALFLNRPKKNKTKKIIKKDEFYDRKYMTCNLSCIQEDRFVIYIYIYRLILEFERKGQSKNKIKKNSNG